MTRIGLMPVSAGRNRSLARETYALGQTDTSGEAETAGVEFTGSADPELPVPSVGDQPLFDGKFHEIGGALGIECRDQLALVIFHGPHRDLQFGRNLLHALALFDQARHLGLARRPATFARPVWLAHPPTHAPGAGWAPVR